MPVPKDQDTQAGSESVSASASAAKPKDMRNGAPTESSVSEIQVEQAFVDTAYATLDKLRSDYRTRQRQVEAEGAWGSPQARTERDALAAHYGDQAMRLEQIEERLVFGRIDTVEQKEQNLYIGRASLRGANETRLLIDWRAPAARPFYQATFANPEGVVRRRHISTKNRRVTGIEDDVLNAQAAAQKGLTFQGEGALLSALSTARPGQMQDIVSTIQAEQDQIIRAHNDGILVVQGGPGTGKTAVALHRAAYLLYTERERLENQGVLIVGPSKVFLKYIEKVLPALGETGVVSLTLSDLVAGERISKADEPEVAKAKGSIAWVQTLKNAVRDLQRIPREDKVFQVAGRKLVLTVEDFQRARTRARLTGKPHNVARDGFALELIELLAQQMGEDPDPETQIWWHDLIRASRDIRREINLCWMPTTARGLLEKLFSQPTRLSRVAKGLSALEQAVVYRPKGAEFTIQDVPLLDELEELLGTNAVLENAAQKESEAERQQIEREAAEVLEAQGLGEGIVTAQMLADLHETPVAWRSLAERALADRTWTYGHIVVDEAQELSHMAWHSLLRRCPSRSFTIVGDLDQARGVSGERPRSWAEVLGPAARAGVNEMTLTVSYRTPATIVDLAQDVLADLGEPVRFPLTGARDVPNALADTLVTKESTTNEEDSDRLLTTTKQVVAKESWRLDALVGTNLGKIAVIVPDVLAQKWGFSGDNRYCVDERVNYLTVVAAKGLEFDTVVVVEPELIAKQGLGDLFVAMTRCTSRLHSVRQGSLPQRWRTAL